MDCARRIEGYEQEHGMAAWWLTYAVLFLCLFLLTWGMVRPLFEPASPRLQVYQAQDLSDFDGIMTRAGAQSMIYDQFAGVWVLFDADGREVGRIELAR